MNNLGIRLGLSRWVHRLVTPLGPAATVSDTPFLFHGCGTGQEKNLCFDTLWVNTRPLPESRRFRLPKVDRYHPLQLSEGVPHLIGIGTTAGRVLPPGEKSLETSLVHPVKDHQPGIIDPIIYLGLVLVAELIFRRCRIPIDRFQVADRIFRIVSPPVGAERILGGRRIMLVVFFQGLVRRPWGLEIPGDNVPQKTVVRGSLHIGLATEGVNSTTRHTDVAQKELNNGHSPDVLGSIGMLGPSHGVHACPRLVRLVGLAVGLIHLNQKILRSPRNGRYLVQCVTGIEFL